jgi:hypothetical protein
MTTAEVSDQPTTPTEFPGPEVTEPPPAYANGATFELVKPVELEQLKAEINKATKRSVEISQSGPPSGLEPISDTNRALLSITPGNVSRDAVQKVIDDHVPDGVFGVPESEQAYQAVVQKIVDDPEADLSPEEMLSAVRGLVLRSTMVASSTPLLGGTG